MSTDKTDAELYAQDPSIEPENSHANALAERVMMQFEAEHFQPLLKKVANAVSGHLWNIFRDHIISDAEMSVAGHIRDRIERSVEALLSGQEWAIEKYVLHDYNRLGVREAIAKLVPKELQDKRVAELEEEVERLRADLGWYRERF